MFCKRNGLSSSSGTDRIARIKRTTLIFFRFFLEKPHERFNENYVVHGSEPEKRVWTSDSGTSAYRRHRRIV